MAGLASRRTDAALIVGACAAVAVLLLTLPLGRPVNDDYWGLGALMSDSFISSLAWYFTDFQGNVTSWFFILLHDLAWLDGVQVWGSALSIALTFAILAGACWGGLTFLGFAWPTGWRLWAALAIATVTSWLSLASVVSPNAMILVFYMPSTIVHVWPWCFAVLALGLVVSTPTHRAAWIATGACGFLAGNLGFVEGIAILAATVAVGLILWRTRSASRSAALYGWLVGLGAGLALQMASPATWGRSGGLGSEGALSTNVQAVERLLAQGDAVIGGGLSTSLLSVMAIDGWARVLVPAAVVGDLFLRPGLLAVLILAASWAIGWGVSLDRRELKWRLLALSIVSVGCGVLYSLSGALYAYAGRHVAGLALIVTVLVAGLGGYTSSWWTRHRRTFLVSFALSVVVLLLLGVQQVMYGIQRSSEWDAALEVNRQLISEGRLDELLDVPLKAGLSQSGLRDHDGSGAYVEWVRLSSR